MIVFTGRAIADPLTVVLIGGFIVWSAITLVRESGVIFFQHSPVPSEEVREKIESGNGVEPLEDTHV